MMKTQKNSMIFFISNDPNSNTSKLLQHQSVIFLYTNIGQYILSHKKEIKKERPEVANKVKI